MYSKALVDTELELINRYLETVVKNSFEIRTRGKVSIK